jgi:hypothetical protein
MVSTSWLHELSDWRYQIIDVCRSRLSYVGTVDRGVRRMHRICWFSGRRLSLEMRRQWFVANDGR